MRYLKLQYADVKSLSVQAQGLYDTVCICITLHTIYTHQYQELYAVVLVSSFLSTAAYKLRDIIMVFAFNNWFIC